MTTSVVARRYAGALFDTVQKAGGTEALDRVQRDLAGVLDLVASHAELKRVFESPAVSPQKKRAIVEGLVAAAPDLGGEVRRLLLLLAERDRLALLESIAQAFDERLMALRRVMPAEIVTAVPLSEEAKQSLAQVLGRATDHTVLVTERVDPAIIGGVVAKVGSVVFDGSVARQLERMRQRLLANQ